MSAWLVIVTVGLGSYLFRAGPVVTGARWTASPAIERAIGRAGTAALAALVVGGLRHESTGSATAAGVVAAAAVVLSMALRGQSLLRALLAGAAVHAAIVTLVSLG
jgi:branched-subunit amino acid transport protein